MRHTGQCSGVAFRGDSWLELELAIAGGREGALNLWCRLDILVENTR
jgi:hypothetical protein